MRSRYVAWLTFIAVLVIGKLSAGEPTILIYDQGLIDPKAPFFTARQRVVNGGEILLPWFGGPIDPMDLCEALKEEHRVEIMRDQSHPNMVAEVLDRHAPPQYRFAYWLDSQPVMRDIKARKECVLEVLSPESRRYLEGLLAEPSLFERLRRIREEDMLPQGKLWRVEREWRQHQESEIDKYLKGCDLKVVNISMSFRGGRKTDSVAELLVAPVSLQRYSASVVWKREFGNATPTAEQKAVLDKWEVLFNNSSAEDFGLLQYLLRAHPDAVAVISAGNHALEPDYDRREALRRMLGSGDKLEDSMYDPLFAERTLVAAAYDEGGKLHEYSQEGLPVPINNESYRAWNCLEVEPATGTSTAAPVLAGFVAQLRSMYPDLTAAETTRIINHFFAATGYEEKRTFDFSRNKNNALKAAGYCKSMGAEAAIEQVKKDAIAAQLVPFDSKWARQVLESAAARGTLDQSLIAQFLAAFDSAEGPRREQLQGMLERLDIRQTPLAQLIFEMDWEEMQTGSSGTRDEVASRASMDRDSAITAVSSALSWKERVEARRSLEAHAAGGDIIAAVWVESLRAGGCYGLRRDPRTSSEKLKELLPRLREREQSDDSPLFRYTVWLAEDGSDPSGGANSLNSLEQAVEMGYGPAISRLAAAYANGDYGLTKDLARAYELYTKAAELGDARGYYGLGLMLHFGEHVAVNLSEAKRHYEKAVELGYSSAIIRLALYRCYYLCERHSYGGIEHSEFLFADEESDINVQFGHAVQAVVLAAETWDDRVNCNRMRTAGGCLDSDLRNNLMVAREHFSNPHKAELTERLLKLVRAGNPTAALLALAIDEPPDDSLPAVYQEKYRHQFEGQLWRFSLLPYFESSVLRTGVELRHLPSLRAALWTVPVVGDPVETARLLLAVDESGANFKPEFFKYGVTKILSKLEPGQLSDDEIVRLTAIAENILSGEDPDFQYTFPSESMEASQLWCTSVNTLNPVTNLTDAVYLFDGDLSGEMAPELLPVSAKKVALNLQTLPNGGAIRPSARTCVRMLVYARSLTELPLTSTSSEYETARRAARAYLDLKLAGAKELGIEGTEGLPEARELVIRALSIVPGEPHPEAAIDLWLAVSVRYLVEFLDGAVGMPPRDQGLARSHQLFRKAVQSGDTRFTSAWRSFVAASREYRRAVDEYASMKSMASQVEWGMILEADPEHRIFRDWADRLMRSDMEIAKSAEAIPIPFVLPYRIVRWEEDGQIGLDFEGLKHVFRRARDEMKAAYDSPAIQRYFAAEAGL